MKILLACKNHFVQLKIEIAFLDREILFHIMVMMVSPDSLARQKEGGQEKEEEEEEEEETGDL